MGKTEKAEPDLKLLTLRPGGPTPWGARQKKINQVTHLRNSDRGRRRGLTSNLIVLCKNSWSCPEAYGGVCRRQKSPLDCAIDFLAKIWQHITIVSFFKLSFCFLLESLKMPWNMSKLSLFIILLISNMYGGFFFYKGGLVVTTCMQEKHIMVTPTLPRCKN